MKQMPRIKMMGIGHGGNHMLDYVMNQSIRNVEYITVADEETLLQSGAERSIQLDAEVMKCFYMDGHLNVKKIKPWITMELDKVLIGAEVLFIMAGMGGQVGSDIAPIVAQRAKKLGIVTMALVTRPFSFEGKMRWNRAQKGIEYLTNFVDSLVIIPNDRLIDSSEKNTSFMDAFAMADDVLRQGVQGISDLISKEGYVNVDYADVRTTMEGRGVAHMGVGVGSGDNKVEEAVRNAIESPLLETSVDGARSILLYVSGGLDMGMLDISKIAEKIQAEADPDANIIFGASVSEDMADKVSVTLIATDFQSEGISGSKIESPKISTQSPSRKTVSRDGLEGVEVTLDELMRRNSDPAENSAASEFDVPDFLR